MAPLRFIQKAQKKHSGGSWNFNVSLCGVRGQLGDQAGPVLPAAHLYVHTEVCLSSCICGFQVLNNGSEVSTAEGRRNIFSWTTLELLLSSLKSMSERETSGQTVGLLSSRSGA